MEHCLKTSPDYLDYVADGSKGFEVREDDREPPFALGDTLLLEGYSDGEYTGCWVRADVDLVLRGEYCKDGYCIMSITPTAWHGFAPPTYAERIRAMTNEELAEFIWRTFGSEPICRFCAYQYKPQCTEAYGDNADVCRKGLAQRLSQPAEED